MRVGPAGWICGFMRRQRETYAGKLIESHRAAARETLLNGNHILALCSWISKPLDP